MKRLTLFLAGLLFIAGGAGADEVIIEMSIATDSGKGQAVGTVTVKDTPYGALFTPDLNGLPPGLHGFHVHEFANCGPGEKDGKKVPGLAAGGHYDPDGSDRHAGPYGEGHLGDLPPLYVKPDGTSVTPVLAPRVKTTDLSSRSLMIHAGGDNYADHPEKLGGGGARIACGVVP
ncbi:superoxide dismutase [Cu-Zn] SodC [Desulfosarcina sp.]|uniref:superoxide dismutase [Cu-Zn] SodC n=1 Tax=Desulfosarcina sp. TaxID=2027861 RepID=UPI00397069CB